MSASRPISPRSREIGDMVRTKSESPPSRQLRFSSDAGIPTKISTESTNSALPRRFTDLSSTEQRHHGLGTVASSLRRRSTRGSRAFRTASTYNVRKGWQPGAEPGLDVDKEDGGRGYTSVGPSQSGLPHGAAETNQKSEMHEECEITVVDFSQDDTIVRRLDNQELEQWIESEETKSFEGHFGRDTTTQKLRTREEWVKCRWINVNGLSWDVIRSIGKWKKLHRLAIEDLVNTKNRIKADWYDDHMYLVLTLQKLVHLHSDSESDSDHDARSDTSLASRQSKSSFSTRVRKMVGLSSNECRDISDDGEIHDPSFKYVTAHTHGSPNGSVQKLRTLQRYHDDVNEERATFMEAHSALTAKNLAVCAEQVSVFLCADSTVISFFQSSGEDLERPLLSRLSSPDTILRRTCDGSMLLQSLLDAIVDLAIPVTTAYQDVIGDLEVDILTEPSIKHTTGLYIVSSEISKMRSFIAPIANLINAMRDHKSDVFSTSIGKETTTVHISPVAQTYLGDVEDHIILILSQLDQMSTSSSHLIDLIFNTISAFQNESMKQLTIVTIFFLPLTFITGYFGMNLTQFPSLEFISENLFWAIAIPTVCVVLIFLMRGKLTRSWRKTVVRRGIRGSRRKRLEREGRMR